MLNKRFLYLDFLIPLFCMFSCGNKENFLQAVGENHNLLKKIKFVTGSLALAISYTDIHLTREVRSNVSSPLALGIDEVFYLNEIVNENKNINRHLLQRSISNNITKKGNGLNASRGSSDQGIWYIIGNDNLNIYGPYSENWNRSYATAIVFLNKENINNLYFAALVPIKKDGHIRYDTIIVNEGYTEGRPVWILCKKSDRPYENIPQLADGNRKEGSIYFSGSEQVNSSFGELSTGAAPVKQKIHNVKVGKFMASKQFDPWLKGGSEFYLYCTETSINAAVGGNAAELGASTQINMIFVDRPRKAIKRKEWVDVNQNAVSNWRQEVHKSTIVVVEKDWEGVNFDEEKIPFDIPITLGGQTTNLKGFISIERRDEHITTKVFDRNYIFSSFNFNNNTWMAHGDSGVNWTLPYSITDSYL